MESGCTVEEREKLKRWAPSGQVGKTVTAFSVVYGTGLERTWVQSRNFHLLSSGREGRTDSDCNDETRHHVFIYQSVTVGTATVARRLFSISPSAIPSRVPSVARHE